MGPSSSFHEDRGLRLRKPWFQGRVRGENVEKERRKGTKKRVENKEKEENWFFRASEEETLEEAEKRTVGV